jgi:lipopolysaccharide/colanic/teichoic acid biosynthesis glycosyltransferase
MGRARPGVRVVSRADALTDADPSSESADALRPVGPKHVWGSDPIRLYELFWASRCIQVVRPHATVFRHGPALYLLLRTEQLVTFPIQSILKKMHWAAPSLLRLRINHRGSSECAEHVDTSEDTVRFYRSYGRQVSRSDRAWITADAQVAEMWVQESGVCTPAKAAFASVPRDETASIVVDGSSFHADDDSDLSHWLSEALQHWEHPNSTVPDLYEYQPGVWVHAKAAVSPSARIIGPAWIGVGQQVEDDGVLVGPVILPDVNGFESATKDRDIDWEVVRSTHWSLPNLARGSSFRRLTKRAFDIVFSLAVLAVTLPVCLPILLAIYREDGRPFFFAHRRQTLGGRDFPCLKFRTMRKDAEKMKAELMAANAADGPQFFIENDPRVTRVGRVLRKFQLDELPQFINVLLGHMSVVGPRPSPDKENQYCPAWREARLSVRPGVTGLWQVRRTREPQTDFQEWIRYDLEYVQHQSFVGDLKIILDTVRYIFKSTAKVEESGE